jgi:hypothetical protein
VSWLSVVLLASAVLVVVGAEWPRISQRLGFEARRKRKRNQRKSQLRLLRSETDDFAASVERDLDQLPTIEEHDRH